MISMTHRAPIVLAAALSLLAGAAQAESGPFAALNGTWSGGGTIDDGERNPGPAALPGQLYASGRAASSSGSTFAVRATTTTSTSAAT